VGDTLAGIEWFFGVTVAKVRALNPGMRVPIRPGDKIKIPTPTRWNS
jgi:LysM repeat protein